MPSDIDALLRSVRRWLLAIAFLLGIGVIALANMGYLLTFPTFLYSLVFSIAGVIGGVVALIAGLKLLGSYSPSEDGGQSTE